MTQGNFLSPGTQVQQVRKGPVVPPAIATAIGGYLLYCQKGPVGTPIEVVSLDDAAEVFGGRITSPGNSRLTDSLIDFFAEGGGSCFVSRYTGLGAQVASRTLYTTGLTFGAERSIAGSFPVTNFADGDTFTGEVDGASTIATVNGKPASVTGAAATYAAVTPGHTLTVRINGVVGNQIITFNGTEATETAFRNQINAQIRGAAAIDNAGQVELQTEQAGSGAGGAIVAGSVDVLASLGFVVGPLVNPGPNNVADLAAVTASELADIFDAAFPGSTSTANGDNSLTWTTDTLGGAGSVQFTAGPGVAKVAGFDLLLHSGSGTVPLPTILVTAASGNLPSPGSWGNAWATQTTQQTTYVANPAPTAAGVTSSIVLSSTARVSIGDTLSITQGSDVQRFVVNGINGTTVSMVGSITVPGGGYAGTEQVMLETFTITVYDNNGTVVFPSPFRNLRTSPLAGANYFPNIVNSAARTPINVEDLAPVISDARPVTDDVPVLMAGGADGAAPTASDVIAQIASFDKAPTVNEISIPGAATDYPGVDGVGILTSLQAYLLNRQDVMGIIDEPKGTPPIGPGGARDWIQNTANLASQYLAVYWPWVQRLDVTTGILTSFPMSPHVQGIIARTHATRNFGKAPAGIVDGQLANVQGLEYVVQEQSPEYNDAYPAGVNFALKFPGQGFAVWGSRTLDPTGEFGQINVQIVFNVNKRLIKKSTRFVNFEFNDETTRRSVVRVLTAMFREQRKAGILAGKKDNEAFFIICDDTNNTPLVIASGKLICRIGLAINRPVEFQEYTLELDTRAVDAELGNAQANA